MHPRTRTILVAAVATVFAVAAGANLAGEGYFLSAVLLALVLWIIAEWAGGPVPEAWALTAVIVGYILGNRGFAQISLSTRVPLLPAEVALLVCVPAIFFRAAFRQTAFLRRDPLNYAILLWMIVAAARLPVDWEVYDVIALRDFAMIYYATFFFIGQALGTHPRSVALLGRGLTFAFLLLPPLAAAFRYAPDFFINEVTFRDIPVIYYKGDLIATSLVAGFFWFWAKSELKRQRRWVLPGVASLGLVALMASPRAAMVGAVGVTFLWLLGRRWRILAWQGAMVAIGLMVALLFYSILTPTEFRRTPFYAAYEHAISIVDIQGKRTYWNKESGDPGGNNRFRLVWWRAVYRETMDVNPVFGLGFGHDLSARFLADYEWLTNEDFSARSPHSMFMTMLGRLGLVGVVLWLSIGIFMARRALVAFRQQQLAALGWWSITWTIWISACFGVVLEGPMGAVIFWTTMGVANALSPAAALPKISTSSAPLLRADVRADEVAPAS